MNTHYRALCPICGFPNTQEIPRRQRRKTIDFICAYEIPEQNVPRCNAKFKVLVDQTETLTPNPHKTKPYMNRVEREAFLVSLNISDHFANIVMNEISSIPENTKYAFKQIQGWLSFGAYEWVKEKGARTVEQLNREKDMYSIGLILNRNAKEIAKKNSAADAEMRNKIIEEDREPILDLALATFQFCCRNCDGKPALHEDGCPVKVELDKLAIPTWEAVEECHYAYSGLIDEEIAERKAKPE